MLIPSHPFSPLPFTSRLVPSRLSERGYARHMLQLLHYCIALPDSLPPFPSDRWGAPPSKEYRFNDATFSSLWSGIGRDFYQNVKIGTGKEAKKGWVVHEDDELTWRFTNPETVASQPKVKVQGNNSSTWQVLRTFDQLSSSFLETYEEDLVARASKYLDKTVVLDSATSPDVIKYFIRRGVPPYTATERYETIQNNLGLYKPETGSFVLFSPKYTLDKPPQLYILALRLTKADEEEFPVLLDAIEKQAKAWDCESAVAWEVPESLKKVWLQREGTEAGVRNDDEGAMAWYGPGPAEEAEMVGGEKFTWA